MKFTVKAIAALQLPPGKSDHIAWDDDIGGFGLRFRAGGSRTWVYQYEIGKQQHRMVIGSATAVSLVKAREIASELHAKVRLGQDPAGKKADDRQRAGETFEVIARKFLTYQKGELRPGSYRHVERHILRDAKSLHKLQLATIDRRTVALVITAIKDRGAKVAANRARGTWCHFFSWAMNEGYIGQNPIIGMNAFDERPRNRVLLDPELRAIWSAAGDDHFGAIIKLLILTGQRADEIAGVRWPEIGGGAITLPPARVKNKLQHTVPLSDPALVILQAQPRRVNADGSLREFVFGIGGRGFLGWSRCKERLDARVARDVGAPLPHWTVHDIRRSVATGLGALGVQPHVIECVLNHVGGFRTGVSGIYNRNPYEGEKRRALALWASHVMALVEDGEGTVVSLRR
jgi:integrase